MNSALGHDQNTNVPEDETMQDTEATPTATSTINPVDADSTEIPTVSEPIAIDKKEPAV